MSIGSAEKFAQWREYLERVYGPGAFLPRSWLQQQWRAQCASPQAQKETKKESFAGGVATIPDSLETIQQDLRNCMRCKLCSMRTNIVFGEGNPQAQLMFIGEGPGEQEDLQGRPFVGKAGQLLDKIIQAMHFRRDDVYIANVVKCRPPGNRVPEPDEAGVCEQFLYRQIEAVNPKILVALGGTALKCLLHDEQVKITRSRGQFMEYRGRMLMPTFHPSFLLRNPESKKEVWEDMKKVMAAL